MPNLTTRLKEVRLHSPCTSSYRKYIKRTGSKSPVSLSSVLAICGVKDAFWFLRCFEYKDYAILSVRVAERVLHVFEDKYPNDKRPRKALECVREYTRGERSLREVRFAADAAYAANADAAAAANANAAAAAAYAASASADANASASAASAAYAAANAAAAAAYAASASAANIQQWKIIEKLLIDFIRE